MLSFEDFVEIGQDAAGVIEAGTANKVKGIFTTGVQSCMVTIWLCEKATILLHDSSQLKLSEISALIKNYGSVSRLIAFNLKSKSIRDVEERNRHHSRLMEIRGIARVNYKNYENVEVPGDTFAVQCDVSGKFYVIPNSSVSRS